MELIGEAVQKHPVALLLVSVALFFSMAAILTQFGLAPDIRPEVVVPESEAFALPYVSLDATKITPSFAYPDRITIDKIGVDQPVSNPQSRDITVLDEALVKGVVRYPGSGELGRGGNIFLFGHSTSFPVVRNQAYRAFNGLSELANGDEIVVHGPGVTMVFTVDTVTLKDADDAWVSFDTTVRKLTLSTCNTFGEKQERWVVQATYARTMSN